MSEEETKAMDEITEEKEFISKYQADQITCIDYILDGYGAPRTINVDGKQVWLPTASRLVAYLSSHTVKVTTGC